MMSTSKQNPNSEQLVTLMSARQRSEVEGDCTTKTMETEVRITDLDKGKTCTVFAPTQSEDSIKMSTPPFCRICYEGDQCEAPPNSSLCFCLSSRPTVAANPLIQPCSCSGTAGSVHLMCLWRWQTRSQSSTCELCKAPLRIPRGLEMPGVPVLTEALTDRPHTTEVSCMKKLLVISGYLLVLLLPVVVMVMIMTLPIGDQGNEEAGLANSWSMLARVLLSIVIVVVYFPLLYCLIFKRGVLLSRLNQRTSRTRGNFGFSSTRTRSDQPMWYRQLGNREYCYIDVAFAV